MGTLNSMTAGFSEKPETIVFAMFDFLEVRRGEMQGTVGSVWTNDRTGSLSAKNMPSKQKGYLWW